MEIILASASPRRRQLLSLLTTAFLVEASSADETS
ncbi:MAG: Maf family protein, partial [Christensenellaceae bacterium]